MPLPITPVGSSAPVKVQASGDLLTKITNRTGGKLYYKSTESVSTTSNDGNISETESVTVSSPVFVISASTSQVTFEGIPFSDKGIRRWATCQGQTPEVGNDTKPTTGSIYFAACHIFTDSTLTGIEVLNGTVAETNKLIACLYNSQGQLVASSKTEGTTASGAKAFQQLAFTTPYLAPAGKYFIGYQSNGETVRFYSLKAGTTNISCGSTTGEFGKLTAGITPPTTFTEKVAPIATTY